MISKTERQGFEKAGRRAETLACWFLRLKGYKVLKQRFKTRQGEIDIIAKKRKSIVIIEVKQRANAEKLHETVSYENSQRIMNAAEIFLNKNREFLKDDYDLRFDIIHVIGRWKVLHIQDAFQGY